MAAWTCNLNTVVAEPSGTRKKHSGQTSQRAADSVREYLTEYGTATEEDTRC